MTWAGLGMITEKVCWEIWVNGRWKLILHRRPACIEFGSLHRLLTSIASHESVDQAVLYRRSRSTGSGMVNMGRPLLNMRGIVALHTLQVNARSNETHGKMAKAQSRASYSLLGARLHTRGRLNAPCEKATRIHDGLQVDPMSRNPFPDSCLVDNGCAVGPLLRLEHIHVL